MTSLGRVLGALAAVGLAIPTAADVIPPGHKAIRSTTVVRGLDAFPEWAFFLYPTTLSGTSQRLSEGSALSFYKYAGPHLYAARLPVPDTRDAAFFQRGDLARSKEAATVPRTVPESDPTTSVETTWRVKAIKDNVIELEVTVKTNRRSAAAEPGTAPLAALAGAAVVGLLLTRRRA